MPNYKEGSSSSKSRKTVRVPVVTNEHISAIDTTSGSSVISEEATSITNGIIDKYAGDPDRLYVTNRPGAELLQDASAGGGSDVGRGIHYWGAEDKLIFVNGNKVYETNYATPISGTTSFSIDRVYFAEYTGASLGNYLFIIEPVGSRGYYLDSGDNPLVLRSMLNSGNTVGSGDAYDFNFFPTILEGYGPMADGAVELDQYLFVASKDGKIYNSAVGNYLDWSTESFTTAERKNDDLLAIALSKDHLVAMGFISTEFFYDAANATGSPLANRTDIFYSNGIANGQAFWIDGDDIYMVGTKPSGDFELYIIHNFELNPVSTSTINTMLQSSSAFSLETFVLSGFSLGGHTYAVATFFDGATIVQSFVYDKYSDAWYLWDDVPDTGPGFPIIDSTSRTSSTVNIGIQFIGSNGDIIGMTDQITSTTATFAAEIIIGNLEFGTTDRKFMSCLKYIGNVHDTSPILLGVQWSDDDGATWSTLINIDIALGEQLNRLGSFERRKFKFTLPSSRIRMEGVELTYTEGTT